MEPLYLGDYNRKLGLISGGRESRNSSQKNQKKPFSFYNSFFKRHQLHAKKEQIWSKKKRTIAH